MWLFWLQREEEEEDQRQWTAHHLEAANIPNPSILALTPPQGDTSPGKCHDIDIRGPGGFTPLMVASFFGQGIDAGVDDETESGSSGDYTDTGAAGTITDLLNHGAAINAQTDRTGRQSGESISWNTLWPIYSCFTKLQLPMATTYMECESDCPTILHIPIWVRSRALIVSVSASGSYRTI